MADMYMLQKNPEFECRMNGTLIDCVRVDGAGDEGPSHHEVQFLATERHLDLGKACTAFELHGKDSPAIFLYLHNLLLN